MACRKVAEQESLIRIVASPEGLLVPDLKAKLPGRGAYICCNATCIRKAARKGVLTRALKRPVDPSELKGLEARIREAVERKILSFIGILMKGKKIVTGRESIGKFLRKGDLHLLLQASDGKGLLSDNAAGDVPVRVLFNRKDLGSSIGKPPQPVLGILDAGGGRELTRLIDMQNRIELGGGE